MHKIDITESECSVFKGRWSLKPAQVFPALRAVTYSSTLRVIEFGAGIGTHDMFNLLQSKVPKLSYTSYENNPDYVCDNSGVFTVLWDTFPSDLVGDIYDFVIIDGPNGRQRINWYPMLVKHTAPGTIMLIDDYEHFPEFEEALNANFKYDVIGIYRRTFQRDLTWIVVRIN